ncbi:MAG TPA: hypothetical protein VE623_24010 [Acidimicrobiales bacterium]|jgi:hypothetical protein|nr:hypothetical protein [Acidimicrobiales bacterium]
MDLSQLSPSDAVVTLRGLERRYRGLFAGLGEDESPDDLAHRSAGGWSAAEHVVAAARGIAAADRALATVLTVDSPTVAAADVDPAAGPRSTVPSGPLQDRLAELGLEANAAADRIDRVAAEDWSRPATVDDGSGRTVTALDIARAAVDTGITHLREAEKVLAAVRGRPPATG